MPAVAKEILDKYPPGSRWQIHIMSEPVLRDFGCGRRILTIKDIGHKWVTLTAYGTTRKMKRSDFLRLPILPVRNIEAEAEVFV